MNRTTQLARELAFSSPYHYPEILCQIEKLKSRRFPEEKIEPVIRAAMDLAGQSAYSLSESVDKLIKPFSRIRRHIPSLQNLKLR